MCGLFLSFHLFGAINRPLVTLLSDSHLGPDTCPNFEGDDIAIHKRMSRLLIVAVASDLCKEHVFNKTKLALWEK